MDSRDGQLFWSRLTLALLSLLALALSGLGWILYATLHPVPVDDPYRHQPWAGLTLDPPVFALEQLPSPQIQDVFVLDYQRKDYPPSHRLETSIFIHFYPNPKTAQAYQRFTFIQYFRNNDGPWQIDENPDGSRRPTFNSTNRQNYPEFPRQYFRGTGIMLYDRPGHGADVAPTAYFAWMPYFPWVHRVLIQPRQSSTFRQDFATEAVGVKDGAYYVLNRVTWGQSFREGRRIEDYFGPLHHPPADRGSTGPLPPPDDLRQKK